MEDFNWMIGGPQGSGVDTAANIFGKTCGYGGLYVYGRREYHSNIKGLHSYFHLRISPTEVLANVNDVDLLAAFDAETVFRHIGEVSEGGGIIVDENQVNTRLGDVPSLPKEFKSDFSKHLENKGLKDGLNDLLEDAERRGVKVFRVPYTVLLEQVSDRLGMEKLSRATQMINTLAVGISFGLLNYEITLIERAVKAVFAEKPNIAEMNLLAIKHAYNYANETFEKMLKYASPETSVEEERIFLSGNQAVAIGKVLGGCRIQTYYPITPAADESIYLEAHEILETVNPDLKVGVIVIQTEDEIAAINMASGAALTGARASTSTSGPGFSLMVEGLSWAGNNEVPIVLTYYQRGAPSTGLPTRHGQDDLRFAIHGGHGEFPRIVLASGDIKECFYDAVTAFNYAEIFQMPVIHLIDKALANSSQTYSRFDIKDVKIQRGDILKEPMFTGEGFKRFAFTETGISPRVLLGTKNGVHWYTGDEHDEFGHISEESDLRIKMMEKRMGKLETVDKIVSISERVNFFGDHEARNMIVSWGSPKGAIIEALNKLNHEDSSLGFLQIRMVHPLPSRQITEVLKNAERIIDVEMNYSSQLAGILAEKTGISADFQILKYSGRPMTTTEVYNALKLILSGRAPKRQVLTYGS
ncbi:2-oxoacid:acceptor oxidoreductase subunit alpha [Candidatus Bathyarchaeota archaeon]|nr:2-oxoacid:acceptor oxidoreductase subunit alpha [Candidatus Bathyarchaeota archaeon]MBS7631403.1 2-oxoacid:acceptor oxidoreductase subunit alpha [Candidatus Bathyarchaeota archaeon]